MGHLRQFPDAGVNETLQSILDTEISPELIPTAAGRSPSPPRDTIGPYALHDFTLYHVLRHGVPAEQDRLPRSARLVRSSVRWLAAGYPASERTAYDPATIRRWMEVFYRRFFANQFKRPAMPNGPRSSPAARCHPW